MRRNDYLRVELAKSASLVEISGSISHVSGRVATTMAVHPLPEKQRLELPIMKPTYGIVFESLHRSRALFEF
ncbi:MAG: hypothetical protein ACXQTH_02565, partial [Dehalococcoidia bacterium]